MNRSRALLVLAVVLAAAVAQLSGADRAYAPPLPTFTDITAGLTGVSTSSIAWGDYDNDGDLDALLSGDTGSTPVSKIYENIDNGDGTFTFTEDTVADAALAGVRWGSVAWGDYDSDGDLDILLTGDRSVNPNPLDPVSKVYRNDVTVDGRTFIDTGAALTGVHSGSSAWGDYDSDGDLDILLTGDTGSGYVSRIYENINGTSFSRDTVADQHLTGVAYSSVAWGDYDDDGDLDILLTGANSASPFCVSEIYKNNGAGSAFTEDTTADENLTAVSQSSVAWGDYDNDDDLDILLTGSDGSMNQVSEIYENKDDGTFEGDITGTGDGLTNVFYGSVAWGDYNSDGKSDILLTGQSQSSPEVLVVSQIFRNNGVGNVFVDDTAADSALSDVYQSSVAWGDYDNDGDLDILLTGFDGTNYQSFVYQNGTATANTAPSAPTNLSVTPASSSATLSWSAATDTEQTGAPNGLSYNVRVGTTPGGSDVVAPMALANGKRLVAQMGNSGERTSYTLAGLTKGTTYYWSVQAVDAAYAGSAFASEGTFALTDIETGLTGVDLSSAAWGDYDSDGDLDILLTGQSVVSPVTLVSKIYKNTGGTFNEDTAADINLTGVYYSSAAWGDYDLDGDLDILLTGDSGGGIPVSKIYRNDSGVFNDSGVTLAGVRDGSVAWGDYNSDGKPDILLTGYDASDNHVTKIYKNNGSGTFSEDTVAGSGLTGVAGSSVAWGDYNSDGKLDILLTGIDDPLNPVAKIYENNGNGTFSEDTVADSALTGVYDSSVAWGDYDSDGDLDILLTGGTDTEQVSKIYENNGNGTFSEDTVADGGLTGVDLSSAAWGDYDSDGRPDIVLNGRDGSINPVAKIYKNNVNGTFTEETTAGLNAVYLGSVAWGDYNSDGKLDILLTGNTNPGRVSSVYQNYTATANTAPSAPSALSAPFASGVANLSWTAPPDNDETPVAALTYNLRVGTTSGGSQIVSPLSRPNGTRLVPQDGNVGERTSYSLTGLAPGTYYWSVQTVDQSFTGSGFATEGTFDVPAPSFAFSSATYSVNEGGASASVTIERSGSTADTDSVDFATAGGSATAGSDYTNASQTVTFTAGETSKTISIPITDDSSIEGNETVELSLSGESAGTTLGSPSSATLTIVDNDRSFAFSSTAYSVGEAGGTATVTINRTGSTAGTDSVDFATAGGSAIAGSDYTNASQTVSFAPGVTSRTVSIPISDDSSIESDESVGLSLSNPVGAALGSPSSAALTIVDNDRTFALSSATYSVGEAGGAAAITIARSGVVTASDSVQFATANGTASAGSDYTTVNQTVTFASGEYFKTVSVPISDDSSVESSETVLLSLSSPSAGATLGSPSSATLTISDNDVAPPPTTTTTTTTTRAPSGKITSCKLSKTSFPSSQAGKVKLTCKFSPRSKVFRYVLSLKKGKKWTVVKSVKKTGFYKVKYVVTVKKLFAGKAVKRGQYRLKLSADKNSKTLGFRVI